MQSYGNLSTVLFGDRLAAWWGDERPPLGAWCFSYTYGRRYSKNVNASEDMRAVAARASEKAENQ
jgi:hypothetical protein